MNFWDHALSFPSDRMSKSLTASAPKISASHPPATSAWAKGPPNSNLASNTPRSQSPSATTQPSVNPTPSHSRKPSALGGPSNFNSTFKDGVSVPKGIQPSQKPGDSSLACVLIFTHTFILAFFLPSSHLVIWNDSRTIVSSSSKFGCSAVAIL